MSRWNVFRALLLLSASGLMAYVAYRYTLFSPPDHGTLYGKIFPLALVLALLGITLAARPHLCEGMRGQRRKAACSAVTVFGGVWMATGVMCVRSLAAGMVAAPLGGAFDMLHMLSDHVFLPLAVCALAWAPARVARWLGAPEDQGMVAGEPALDAVVC